VPSGIGEYLPPQSLLRVTLAIFPLNVKFAHCCLSFPLKLDVSSDGDPSYSTVIDAAPSGPASFRKNSAFVFESDASFPGETCPSKILKYVRLL